MQVAYRCLSVHIIDSPDAVELIFGPRIIGRRDAESDRELGNLAVVPAHEHNLSGIFATEQLGGEVGVVVICEVLVDLEMQRIRERDYGERRAVGVAAGRGGEDELGRRKTWASSVGDEGFQQKLCARVAGRGEVGISIGKLFSVADDENGGRGLWAGGRLGVTAKGTDEAGEKDSEGTERGPQ